MDYDNASPQCQEQDTTPSKSNPKKCPSRRFSVTDLVNPTKPWMLTDDGLSLLGSFDFVPRHLREGPWSVTATLALFFIMYFLMIMLIGANMLHTPVKVPHGSILDDFVLANDAYLPYTTSWYYNIIVFGWMVYIAYLVSAESMLSSIAWVSFTLWSWSIITLRHGLCVVAPFVPQVRVVTEILRLPVLLSASITFGVWNFVLMPTISLVFIKDSKRRWNFIQFACGFRLTQLHIFNIFFAVLNGAWAQPKRPLHLGDLDAIFVYMAIYMLWYYFVLDRLGIHLYPIFSPRAPWVIFSWLLLVGLCIYGYRWWSRILEPSV